MWVLFKFDLSEFMAFAGTNPFTHNVTVHLKCLFKQQLVEHKVAYRYEKRLSKKRPCHHDAHSLDYALE